MSKPRIPLREALAIGLLLAFALPLFSPPATLEWGVPRAPRGLWERMFLGVPPWWVIGRLACLFAGAALLASRLALPLRTPAASAKQTSMVDSAGGFEWAAVTLALMHALAALFAAQFSRNVEILYCFLLPVPAALLALAHNRTRPPGLPDARASSGLLWIAPLLWLAWLLPTAWRSARAASIVDGWVAIQRLADVALGKQSILTDSAIPVFSNMHMMLEAVFLLGPRRPMPTFPEIQLIHYFWMVVGALAVGALVRRTVGSAAAVVAQAVLLFSPLVLSSPYNPMPVYLGPVSVAVPLLLLFHVRSYATPAAIAAFGPVIGFTVRNPQFTFPSILICFAMLHTLRRMPRIPRKAVAVCVFSGLATILPGFPSPGMLMQGVDQFAATRAQYVGAVRALFGEDVPTTMITALQAGRAGPFDIPLAGLLSPFASSRSPHRLWGDGLLDPFGTVLMTIGFFLCLRQARRSRMAAFVVALMASTCAIAVVSSGDAVSHTRLTGSLVPMAWFAAITFQALSGAWQQRVSARGLTLAVVACIATSGVVVFDFVTPRLLPAASLATALDAVGTRQAAQAAIVDFRVEWMFTDLIATLLPVQPIPVIDVDDFRRFDLQEQRARRRLYLWNTGVEKGLRLSHVICARFPGAAVYTLVDRAGLFHAYAAVGRGARWRPRLGAEHWSVALCDGPMTIATGALAARDAQSFEGVIINPSQQ